jgi:hypothetical protein
MPVRAKYAAFYWWSLRLSFWPKLVAGAGMLAKTKPQRPPKHRFDICGTLKLRRELTKLQIERNIHAQNDRKPCPS